MVGSLLRRLEALLERGQQARRIARGEPAQVCGTTGKPLGEALSVAGVLRGLLEQLSTGAAELSVLGATRRRDEIREPMV